MTGYAIRADAVRVFIDAGERKTCTQLPADLFCQRVRKLPACVRLFKLLAVRFVQQRIKRQRIDNLLFFLIDNIVDTDIQSAQQHAAFFEYAETFC